LTFFSILTGVGALILAIVALHDLTQRQRAITRNFPVIGHVRYWFDELGQPLRQYWFAGDRDERPYDRVTRSWVYASAKGQNNLVGFGSQADHQELGRILIVPSSYPTIAGPAARENDLPRPRLIGAKRGQPYQPRPSTARAALLAEKTLRHVADDRNHPLNLAGGVLEELDRELH
jgi:hypothetical protein